MKTWAHRETNGNIAKQLLHTMFIRAGLLRTFILHLINPALTFPAVLSLRCSYQNHVPTSFFPMCITRPAYLFLLYIFYHTFYLDYLTLVLLPFKHNSQDLHCVSVKLVETHSCIQIKDLRFCLLLTCFTVQNL